MPTDMAACTASNARQDAPAFSKARRRPAAGRTGGAAPATTQYVAEFVEIFSTIVQPPERGSQNATLNGAQG
jgi:hypothetical protein